MCSSDLYNTTHEAVSKLHRALLDKGLFTFTHWNTVMCNPPLCINEQQLAEAFAIFDDALSVTDKYFEG